MKNLVEKINTNPENYCFRDGEPLQPIYNKGIYIGHATINKLGHMTIRRYTKGQSMPYNHTVNPKTGVWYEGYVSKKYDVVEKKK
jgi:hypothetical protein